MAHTPGPWKVIIAGNQWAITTKAKRERDDDEICMGSQYSSDWQDNAKLLCAATDMLEALKVVAAHSDDKAMATLAAKAIKKAGA